MSSPQLAPDQAKFILSAALPTLKNEHQTTKRVIEAIPLDKGDYRPDAVSKTALELAWHIVASEHRFFSGLSLDEVADVIGISRATAERDWQAARAWLFKELSPA